MKRLLLIGALALVLLGASLCSIAADPLLDVYRLMAHGESEQAIERLEKILAEAPAEDAEFRARTNFLLGRAHESLSEWDSALRHYRVVTHEFTTSEVFADACLALAQLYGRQREPQKAVIALEAALSRELSPEHEFRAQLLLAEIISVPGTGVEDLDRALKLFHALDEKAHKPADVARLNYGLGFCYQRRGDWAQAEQHYIAAAETAPESLWAAYSRMQRIAYYRQKRFNEDAARLEKQLNSASLGLAGLERIEPRAPNLQELMGPPPTPNGELALPKNAVFSYNGYEVTADTFSLSAPARTLLGRGSSTLIYETTTTRTEIRGTAVRIDLRLRNALFSDNVSLETVLKGPGNKPSRIAGLKELIIDLDTGRYLFR